MSSDWIGYVEAGYPGASPQSPNAAYVTIVPNLVGASMENAWQSRAPKPDTLNVVKVTKDNLVTVAKGLIRKGGPSVKVYTDYFSYGGEQNGLIFSVGDFAVKVYDYTNEREVVRHATLEERKKYDLR